jgi:hypothetical protein
MVVCRHRSPGSLYAKRSIGSKNDARPQPTKVQTTRRCFRGGRGILPRLLRRPDQPAPCQALPTRRWRCRASF